MPVLKYKSVDANKVELLKPLKSDGIYYSEIRYSGEPLVIQTPSLKISNNVIGFNLVNRGYLFTLLEELSNKVVEIVYTNSKVFFNGREFSEKRITQSLQKITEISDSGIALIKNVIIPENIKFYDDSKNEISTCSLPVEGSCILHINRVIFDKKTIRIPIEISHIKITPEKKKILDCILEDSDYDEISEKIPEEISEEIQELNVIVKDFDNLEFFED